MIKIQNFSKKYGDTIIFDNTDFSFPDKGLVCILGPSGCGKSTLLNVLAGFDSDYEGAISVHGTSLSKMSAQELCTYRRDNIGFIFQNYHLLSGYTSAENIVLATEVIGEDDHEGMKKAEELLEMLGIPEKAGQRAESLSGGQKQRVAIARALVNNPSIILADEPTGALDRKNSAEIMELLKNLSKERLVIVITHDKKCAEYAEQIVTIEDGKLVGGHLDNGHSGAEQRETAALTKRERHRISLGKRAWKNFKVHLPRYMAVALAVSIGVVCFALSLSSGNIMEQAIVDFEEKNTAYHNGYIKAEGNEKELLSLLAEDERITHAYAQYVLRDVSVKIGEETVNLPEKYPLAKATEQMSYGVMPRRGENEVALNPSLAAQMDKNIQNLIGKTAELSYGGKTYEVTVSGIFNGTYDDYFVSSDIEQEMYAGETGEAYSVSYDVAVFDEIPAVSDSLAEQNINSKNASAEVEAFLHTFQNLKRLFLVVSILIFAVGIFISAILLVKQQNTRYREAGLLAALGYEKGCIRSIFLYENLALALLAAVCSGILTGLVLVIGNLAGFPLAFSMGQIFVSLFLTAALILVIAFISSIKLLNTEPAEALRR